MFHCFSYETLVEGTFMFHSENRETGTFCTLANSEDQDEISQGISSIFEGS